MKNEVQVIIISGTKSLQAAEMVFVWQETRCYSTSGITARASLMVCGRATSEQDQVGSVSHQVNWKGLHIFLELLCSAKITQTK